MGVHSLSSLGVLALGAKGWDYGEASVTKLKAVLTFRATRALTNLQIGGEDPSNGRRGVLAVFMASGCFRRRKKL